MKSEMKTQVKKVISAAQAGDTQTAETEYVLAARKLDRAGAQNVIHRNAAARKKSQLQRLIKASKQSSQA